MTGDSINHKQNPKAVSPPMEEFTVTLPCHPNDFKEFISNLLGKPQTIEKYFSKGTFTVNQDDILNTFHLVDQRINQQNEATLVQFTVKIIYHDDSSVTLNSLTDFTHYKEIRPIRSESVHLTWVYLVKFQKKNAPEKQQIDLRFSTDRDGGEILHEDGIVIRRGKKWFGPGHISFRISHTERTWGVDIESLLTGQIKTLLKPQVKISDFITKHSERIGFLIGASFLASAIAGVFYSIKKFTNSYLSELANISDKTLSSSDLLSQKVDFLIEIITKGLWPRFSLSIISFLFVSLVLSIFLGIWVEDKADNKPSSFVLLSKASEDFQRKSLEKRKRDWFLFGVSVVTSIVTSVVANIIFTKYFSAI